MTDAPPPSPLIFRRPDGRLVWVCPGAPVPVVEEQVPNYGRLLGDLMAGRLEPVSLSGLAAVDQLARLVRSPSPPPTRVRPGPGSRAPTG